MRPECTAGAEPLGGEGGAAPRTGLVVCYLVQLAARSRLIAAAVVGHRRAHLQSPLDTHGRGRCVPNETRY